MTTKPTSIEQRPGLKRLSGYKGPKRGPFAQAPNKHISRKMRRAKARLDTRIRDWELTTPKPISQNERSMTILPGSGGKLTLHKPGSNKG